MSDQQPHGNTEQPSAKEAKADAKAEKARQKAMRPWYKKKRFVIPLAILAIVVVVSLTGGGNGDTTDVADENGQQADVGGGDDDEGTQVGINEAARDGKFEFTVTSFDCGVPSVGEDPVAEEAQGQFCLLGLRVENIGDEAQALFADNQLLIDDQDREFSANSMATISHNPGGDAFFSEINPGNSVEGEIVFDVPENATIVQVELHDSSLSGGVVVDLN